MDKTRREKEEASLANYFYSFPRNEFRSRREKERKREKLLQDAEEKFPALSA